MIELHEVSKVFHKGRPNEFTALSGINLSVEDKGLVILSGSSGSGKTTMLSLIGCMARPSQGRIFLRDQEITSLPERFLSMLRQKHFGFIFQRLHLIKGMSVLENVMIPAYPMGLPYNSLKLRASEILKRFEIQNRREEKVENLSGGQQQRVAIARALINDPDVIIADEPTAHLDAHLSREFMETIGFLKQEGKTIIIASHDPLVSESTLADRVVHLKNGVMVKDEIF